MLSLTWNATREAFGDKDQVLFAGKPVYGIFVANTANDPFSGAEILPSFSCHDVMKAPEVDGDIAPSVFGVPATGKTIEVQAINFYHLSQGKLNKRAIPDTQRGHCKRPPPQGSGRLTSQITGLGAFRDGRADRAQRQHVEHGAKEQQQRRKTCQASHQVHLLKHFHTTGERQPFTESDQAETCHQKILRRTGKQAA